MHLKKTEKIKIFFLNKIVFLIKNKSVFKPREGAILVNIQTAGEMRLEYNKLINKKNLNDIYFFNENLQYLFNYFSAMFHIIEAAGGLVKNKKGEGLFIFRNDKWDLPKGKIESNESIKAAAIREVKEECGISEVTIIKELHPTFHVYFLKEKAILKCTYWFEMHCNESSALIPQTEEGITEVKWVAYNNLKQIYNNTYESIKEVIGRSPS